MLHEEPLREMGWVKSYAINIPPFWPTDPQVCSYRLKHNLLQEALQHSTAQDILSLEITTEISDLLLRPPEDNPYDVLKQKFIKCIAASEQRQLQ